MGENWFLYMMLVSFAVGATPIFWVRSRQRWRDAQAKDWKRFSATIHSVEQVDAHKNRGNYLRISYSYFVEEYRSGEYHFFAEEGTSYGEVARLLTGLSVDILYNPRHPDISVMEDQSLYAAAANARKRERVDEIPSIDELQFDIATYNRSVQGGEKQT